MPYFDDNPLDKLAVKAGRADAELDLRGLAQTDAMARVERLIDSGGRAQTWLIRFDAAADDGRETLFLPLGRRLLEARRAGRIASCLPASDGAGYYVGFAAPARP
ncbi:MAG: hypothetical protein QNJ91_07690 [Gammaproteobacteria bacterium]|nr:hypothetical protein [Gammaproteobacteria bacterium]